MIVISNTSPINNLAAIDQIDLLKQLYNIIYIPEGVYQELMALKTPIQVSNQVKNVQWIQVTLQMKADLLLIDEKRGISVANNLNLKFTGILGILIIAKQKGLIPDVKSLLEQLQERAGFWLKQDLFQNILERVGE